MPEVADRTVSKVFLRTLAKKVLTIRYNRRPKSSFRMMIAVRIFPRTRAPVYFRGYCQTEDGDSVRCAGVGTSTYGQ